MPATSSALAAGVYVLGFLFIVSVIVAVWKIDEHFVTRREFNEAIADLKAGINGLSSKLGIPAAFGEHREGR